MVGLYDGLLEGFGGSLEHISNGPLCSLGFFQVNLFISVNFNKLFSKRMQPTIQYLGEEDVSSMIYSLVMNNFSKELKSSPINLGSEAEINRSLILPELLHHNTEAKKCDCLHKCLLEQEHLLEHEQRLIEGMLFQPKYPISAIF